MNSKIIKDAAILTVITLVAGLLLSFVYEVTKEPIANQNEIAKQKAYQEVFADADSFKEIEVDLNSLNERVASGGLTAQTINEVVGAYKGSELAGYVITVTTGEAYGGDIQLTVGIQNDGTVNGISFLAITETAGLGMNAKNDAFKGQFAGKQVEAFAYTKTGASSPEQIDAISGATITTNSVVNGVNAALIAFQNVGGEQ